MTDSIYHPNEGTYRRREKKYNINYNRWKQINLIKLSLCIQQNEEKFYSKFALAG